MAATGKDFAAVNVAIWGDDDFLDLTIDEQMLFMRLWTSPGLTYCGAGDWHPGRLAQSATDWTRERIERAAAGLSRGRFLIIDTDTDEFLLRSWIRHDGLWKTPNMAVSMANARADLASRTLRAVVVHEVRRLRDEHPEVNSWKRTAVVSLLDQKATDPATLAPFNPPSNPGANPAPEGNPTPPVTPDLTPGLTLSGGVDPNPPSNPGPTPAPAPAPHQSPAPAPERPAPSARDASHLSPQRESRSVARMRELNATAVSGAAVEVARGYAAWAGGGIDTKTQHDVAREVEPLLADGIDPRQIAEGIKAWQRSDSWSPSQIRRFVAKAARTPDDPVTTKATKKAEATMTAAEQIIAELRQDQPA
ncbi:hypothetical protein [Gordonia iterans]|nr:hypothetical protein [Gordonia iterans]